MQNIFGFFGRGDSTTVEVIPNQQVAQGKQDSKGELKIADEKKYPTEFHKLGVEFIPHIDEFVENYPLLSTIVGIAGPFFTISYLFSFSVLNILTGLAMGTLTFFIGRSIYNIIKNKGLFPYFSMVSDSAKQVKQAITELTAKSKTEEKKRADTDSKPTQTEENKPD